MSNELMPITEISTLAAAVAKSHMINGIDTVEQAFTLMMICQSEGLHPMKALARYHIIEGKPSWKADALLAAFKQRGGHYCFTERTDTKVIGVFEKDGDKQIVEWTYKMAEAAGLTGKKNWKYPRQMLTARVVGEGVRLMDPGISGGFYTAEEALDMEPEPGDGAPRKGTRRKEPVSVLAEIVKDAKAQAVDTAQTAAEQGNLVTILTKIDEARDLQVLEDLVKAEYKIVIGGMNEDDKMKVALAFKSKKKLLVFGSVPGTTISAESSAQTKYNCLNGIAAFKDHDALLAHGSAIENLQDQLTKEDLVEVGKAFQARLAVLSGPGDLDPEPETKPPIPDTKPGIPETKTQVSDTNPPIFETPAQEKEASIESGSAMQASQEKGNAENRAKLDKILEPVRQATEAAGPAFLDAAKKVYNGDAPKNTAGYAPEFFAVSTKNLAHIQDFCRDKAKTAADIKMLRNSLEQVTKEMTIDHYFKAEESIDQAEKKVVPETTKTADPFIAGLEKDKAAEQAQGKDQSAEFDRISADLAAAILPKIKEIKTRAMADACQNTLEDKAGQLTKHDFTCLQEAIEDKRKDFPAFKTPAPAPKKLEQMCLPGTEEPPKKAIIMSYGENDQVPPWIVVGADVSVCAYPGGKPYLQTQITGPVYLERMTKQKCVMVANVSYPVPVSCLQQKEGA